MKKRKRKFAKGIAVDTGDFGTEAANIANTRSAVNQLGSSNLGDTGPQGNESILSTTDNFKARFQSMGAKNILPGAQAYNFARALNDTARAKKAMGVTSKRLTGPTPVPSQENDGKFQICPAGQTMKNGVCVPMGNVPQAQRLNKGTRKLGFMILKDSKEYRPYHPKDKKQKAITDKQNPHSLYNYNKELVYTGASKGKAIKTKKLLVGGLLTAGIRYGLKRYSKASGKKLIDLARGQSTKFAKSDKVEAIKVHGGSKLTKSDKLNLNYYKDIL